MELRIVDYTENLDLKLLDLFYQSIFYDKKEFDYVRVPNQWIYRYKISGRYIVKIAILEDEIIASLGILIRNGMVNGEKVKIGCFVDNCILPKYRDHFEEVFSNLFKEAEKDAKKAGVAVIYGWDFLKDVEAHRNFFENQRFVELQGVNWFSSGINIRGNSPFKWKAKVSTFWKVFFKSMMYYYRLRSHLIRKLPEEVIIRTLHDNEIKLAHESITKHREECFFSSERFEDFKRLIHSNILHVIVAEKDSRIVGVLTYVSVAWGGWMFKKLFYDKNPQTFFGFTPDEFVVLPEYQNSSLPSNMILHLMKINSLEKKEFNFVASIFDRREGWKRKAFQKLGFTEPKFDYGAILAKSLKENIVIDPDKIESLPARYIIAPVPPITDSKSDS